MTSSPDVAISDDALDAMLADPEIRQSLAVIVANAPTLAALAAMGTALLQRGPELTENINGMVRQLREESQPGQSGRLGTAVTAMAELAPVATALANRSETITGFLDSAILQPEIVQIVSFLGTAALEADKRTRGKTVEVGGVFALMREIKNPEVQETLAFLLEFAKVFGARQRAGD